MLGATEREGWENANDELTHHLWFFRFWIKYISRDEVELLASGTNGTEGMRLAAYTQPDDSPLYGFIKFRRRAVLVKYVPDGTSRVVKGAFVRILRPRLAENLKQDGWDDDARKKGGGGGERNGVMLRGETR